MRIIYLPPCVLSKQGLCMGGWESLSAQPVSAACTPRFPLTPTKHRTCSVHHRSLYVLAKRLFQVHIRRTNDWLLPFCGCQVGGTFAVEMPSNHVPCCPLEPCCLITGEGEYVLSVAVKYIKKKKKALQLLSLCWLLDVCTLLFPGWEQMEQRHVLQVWDDFSGKQRNIITGNLVCARMDIAYLSIKMQQMHELRRKVDRWTQTKLCIAPKPKGLHISAFNQLKSSFHGHTILLCLPDHLPAGCSHVAAHLRLTQLWIGITLKVIALSVPKSPHKLEMEVQYALDRKFRGRKL